MGCLVWDQSLIYILHELMHRYSQYHIDGLVQNCSNSSAKHWSYCSLAQSHWYYVGPSYGSIQLYADLTTMLTVSIFNICICFQAIAKLLWGHSGVLFLVFLTRWICERDAQFPAHWIKRLTYCRWHIQMYFLQWVFKSKLPLKSVFNYPIDNKATMIQIMAWHLIYDKRERD